ncbi:MAG: hypothetical protein JWP74_3145 [Marmoricola sp.]|nr:hypothetical protein [Marmoricola sp.]
MRSSKTRRLLVLGPCAAVSVALLGAGITPAGATQTTGSGDQTVTISGDPVYLSGDGGVNCADPANAKLPASLSGPLTLTVAVPARSYAMDLALGSTGLVGFSETRHATGATLDPTFSLTIPVTGVKDTDGQLSVPGDGYRFTCQDAVPGKLLPITFNTYNIDSGHRTTLVGDFQLSAVD